MFAVVETGGTQVRVSEGDVITLDRMDAEVGATVELDRVLLVHKKKVKIGTPTVKGAKVSAEVVSHDLGAKRETYTYRRRNSYRNSRGFRPQQTTLKITGIKS